MRYREAFYFFSILLAALCAGGVCGQTRNYGGSPMITVRDCQGKESGWPYPGEPKCKWWIIVWHDPDGKIWGEIEAKTREELEKKRDYNMRLFKNTPLAIHYQNPSDPICDTCFPKATLEAAAFENAARALEQFENLLLKANLALDVVLKEGKSSGAAATYNSAAEAIDTALANYARALTGAREKLQQAKHLLMKTERAGQQINSILESSLQDFERAMNQVEQSFQALPAIAVTRLRAAGAPFEDYKETAQLLINEGKDSEAVETIKEGIRLNPASPTALTFNNLGMAYQRLGRFAESVEAFQSAIRIDPNLAPTYYNLGSTYIMMGRHEDAVTAELTAIRLQPDLAEAHNQLGLAYLNLKRYAEAIAAFNKAISLLPNADVPHFNLGMTYLRQGNRQAAQQQYDILRQMNSKMAQNLYDSINNRNSKPGDVPYVLVPSAPKPQ